MALSFSDSELAAYLEEDLDAERASALEQALPGDELLLQRLQTIRQQNDSGEHTLGSIWRQQGLSCPSRKTLGASAWDPTARTSTVHSFPHRNSQVHHLPCRCRRFAATANSESRNEGNAYDKILSVQYRLLFTTSE